MNFLKGVLIAFMTEMIMEITLSFARSYKKQVIIFFRIILGIIITLSGILTFFIILTAPLVVKVFLSIVAYVILRILLSINKILRLELEKCT